ncbi:MULTISPECIES: hypothetical protein [Variovorax]|uniref:hypothetical protein n=1 Tax=Variovorax TaxID=34072 RepID=UPI002859B529|nr:hypothetical protein [Variovorax sp. 3319]MDR6886853.1 hypothetical protein [Variovorax sp. 3319]
MHPNARALVAGVAVRIVAGGGSVGAVYDYSQSKYIQISGSVNAGSVSVYDHDRGCHFSGAGGSLYDYGRGAYVSLQFNGNSFSGYDYGEGHHFSGTINGGSASLYDYGEGGYFNFSA